MNVRNCKVCGKIFNYDGFNVCRACRRKQDERFQRVKEYLREYPGASINEVEDATDVSSEEIMEFLREGRLEMDENSQITLDCERCGAKIFTGRFCSKCTSEMSKSLGAVARGMQSVPKPEPKKTGKDPSLMRAPYDRDRDR
ncbi:MAG: MerR family transcriptional regulator [Tissierellia bacterium]|nr:MerR family transcriptional regulator [Tissierellia bacterium]